MARALTRCQARVLLFIDDYVTERGYPPTYRDISAHMGAVSPHTAYGHREALARKGMLRMQRYKGRTLQLTELGRQRVAELREEARVRAAIG